MTEGSKAGSGSVHRMYGFGSLRPKNIRILRIRIGNTAWSNKKSSNKHVRAEDSDQHGWLNSTLIQIHPSGEICITVHLRLIFVQKNAKSYGIPEALGGGGHIGIRNWEIVSNSFYSNRMQSVSYLKVRKVRSQVWILLFNHKIRDSRAEDINGDIRRFLQIGIFLCYWQNPISWYVARQIEILLSY